MHTEAYQETLLVFRKKIELLPSNEIKYFLLLLFTTLQRKESPYFQSVLIAAIDFTEQCHVFINMTEPWRLDNPLQKLQQSYQSLVKIAGTRSKQTQIIQVVLNVGGALTALLFGLIGGLIGGFAGLLRAGALLENPIRHAVFGFIAGFCIGAMIGFRAPKKLAKDELFRQIKYTIDGLGRSLNHLASSQFKPFSQYQDALQKRLLKDYFNNNQQDLDEFLEGQHTYHIMSLKARFISETLKGYVGHHALIKLTIANKDLALEFSMGGSNLKESPAQCEERQVSGQQLLDMMAFHEQLQATHACTKTFIATRMKSGETDCLSYVNQILTGTNQRPTRVTRVTAEDSRTARMVGFFATRFSPFSESALQQADDYGLCPNKLPLSGNN